MTNREFYKNQRSQDAAFARFCKKRKCAIINPSSAMIQEWFVEWIDATFCASDTESPCQSVDDRHKPIITDQCQMCSEWEPTPFSADETGRNLGRCKQHIKRRATSEKRPETCAWFYQKKPIQFSESADTPVLRPDRRRVAPCNCSHHGEPILGSDHGRCNHPANSATVTTCGFWNAADCFRFAENENTKTVDTPPPAPSAPATESVPCAPSHGSVPPFAPTLADAFEALERKAYYRGLLHGLNEAKRHLQISAAVNAKTAEGHCLRGDAAHKLNEVNELIEAAQKECEK